MQIKINNRALLKISGNDSESFLQNQLSNDISKLEGNIVQINAYCQHQGKIISLFWVMRYKDFFLLSFSRLRGSYISYPNIPFSFAHAAIISGLCLFPLTFETSLYKFFHNN